MRPAPGPRGDRVCAKIWFTYESVDGAPMGPAWGAPPPSPVSSLPGLGIGYTQLCVGTQTELLYTVLHSAHTHTHTHTHTTKLTFYAKTNPSTHMPAPAYAKRSRCPAPKLRSNKTLPPAPPSTAAATFAGPTVPRFHPHRPGKIDRQGRTRVGLR